MLSPDGRCTVVTETSVDHFDTVDDAVAAGLSDTGRVVWWRASQASPLIARRPLARVWDLAAVHRLVVGGSRDDDRAIWAARHSLALDEPARSTPDPLDLFAAGEPGEVRPGAALPRVAGTPDWLRSEQHRASWGRHALDIAAWQHDRLAERRGRFSAATAESGAAMLCVELENEGLPVDRPVLEQLIAASAGPRPRTDDEAIRVRQVRDELVWRHVPGGRRVDLRNPAAVREMLRQVGVVVDDTRAWHLEPYRAGSPLVDALLNWRKAERIATTYGWSWLAEFVGADDRLRGAWDASDGGAGRMTAGSGLHSLPATLRPGVAAAPGHVLVRADLGQIEPRVLAVVSRDPALAEATRSDDLYAEIAADLGVDRPTAKVAMLAAMYGQTSGTAGQVLDRLERTYPTAMGFLRAAADSGERGESVVTFGGRLVPVHGGSDDTVQQARARGRFTRNAVVQGAAAEFFKAWALTVRAEVAPLGGRIVLCLHDELLVHAPEEHAAAAVDAVGSALQNAARRWSGGAPVRFVADTGAFHRWSEAKG